MCNFDKDEPFVFSKIVKPSIQGWWGALTHKVEILSRGEDILAEVENTSS